MSRNMRIKRSILLPIKARYPFMRKERPQTRPFINNNLSYTYLKVITSMLEQHGLQAPVTLSCSGYVHALAAMLHMYRANCSCCPYHVMLDSATVVYAPLQIPLTGLPTDFGSNLEWLPPVHLPRCSHFTTSTVAHSSSETAHSSFFSGFSAYSMAVNLSFLSRESILE
jgi:hypothetical protein